MIYPIKNHILKKLYNNQKTNVFYFQSLVSLYYLKNQRLQELYRNETQSRKAKTPKNVKPLYTIVCVWRVLALP